MLGVALGVAVAVSIDLANASATRAFELLHHGARGARHPRGRAGDRGPARAALHPRRPRPRRSAPRRRWSRGTAWPRVPASPGADAARPCASSASTPSPRARSAPSWRLRRRGGPRAAGCRSRRLVTRPGTGLVTPDTAEELGVAPGDAVRPASGRRAAGGRADRPPPPGGPREREVLAGLLVMDVASAQELLGEDRPGARPDRAGPARRPAAGRRTCGRLLPPPARLRPPVGARARSLSEMTRAFRLNLTALSLLALVCGAFLIYNTATFSVVQRRGAGRHPAGPGRDPAARSSPRCCSRRPSSARWAPRSDSPSGSASAASSSTW